jgi:hypothetical protein
VIWNRKSSSRLADLRHPRRDPSLVIGCLESESVTVSQCSRLRRHPSASAMPSLVQRIVTPRGSTRLTVFAGSRPALRETGVDVVRADGTVHERLAVDSPDDSPRFVREIRTLFAVEYRQI